MDPRSCSPRSQFETPCPTRSAAVHRMWALLQRLWIPQRRRWSPRRETVEGTLPVPPNGVPREALGFRGWQPVCNVRRREVGGGGAAGLAGGDSLIQPLRQPRRQLLELEGEVRVMPGPGHSLHSHPVLFAPCPPRRVAQSEHRSPQRQVLPHPLLARVVVRAGPPAHPTPRATLARAHHHHHSSFLQARSAYHQPLHPEHPPQQLSHAHPANRLSPPVRLAAPPPPTSRPGVQPAC